MANTRGVKRKPGDIGCSSNQAVYEMLRVTVFVFITVKTALKDLAVSKIVFGKIVKINYCSTL